MMRLFPKGVAGSSWRVLRGRMGVVLHTAPHPAKGFASGLQSAFGASLLTLAKGRKGMQKEAEITQGFSADAWWSHGGEKSIVHRIFRTFFEKILIFQYDE